MKVRVACSCLLLSAVLAAGCGALSKESARAALLKANEPEEDCAGCGSTEITELIVDSILQKSSGRAMVYYRLSGSYSNASIKDYATKHYRLEPGSQEFTRGALGWKIAE